MKHIAPPLILALIAAALIAVANNIGKNKEAAKQLSEELKASKQRIAELNKTA